ncbi:MAG TPA: arsenate reductase (glutaredoxin) [Candidatus Sulfotelmatobacter sp.]|nr:arsenate reductase (glutaredoxin) [Candidatus Sulfotelmatobacter sp.]
MNEKITVYQKPTCSKCRAALKLLQNHEVECEAINYYEVPLAAEELRSLLQKLGLAAKDLIRRDEPLARQLGIGQKDFSEAELIDLMIQHPDLMQRPIVVRGNQAVLGRPVEQIEKLL